jgi:hypothetical protein
VALGETKDSEEISSSAEDPKQLGTNSVYAARRRSDMFLACGKRTGSRIYSGGNGSNCGRESMHVQPLCTQPLTP